ncbi:mechanosensitive ion channel family protein [Geobacter argillaceus]|jgi:small-conductance mechanosensitive channel|uniref:Mechanosensitive ion channel-like protein n=1 Tax=Geobacter argillaceus TaxID=345631 RepID=A0A562VFI6_9BACT|nr:mechanosensitive ion channel family protein [Geobacter argillaceus]TWJ16547.1 mechanosensitive ion channel-like protein [Geobacter argillaceus]
MAKNNLALALMFLILATCAPAIAQPPVSPATPAAAKPPIGQVMLDGKPVFSIREKVLSFTPADRARAISGRLAKLAKDPLLSIDSFTAVDSETTTDIVAGDTVIMTVTDSDAKAEGKRRRELADELVLKIRTAIKSHSTEYSMNSLLLGGLYAFAATVALILLIVLLNRFLPKLVAKIESWRGGRIRSIRFQSIEILHEDRIVALFIGGAKWVRLLVILGLLYLYIPLVFSFFPWTRGYAAKIFEYVLTPIEKVGHAILTYLPNVFFIAVILVFTHFVIKFTRFFFTEVENRTITLPGFYQDWAEPTFKIVRFMIIAFAAVVAFPYLPGSDSPAFKGISVFLGVLLSLGSTSAVANVVAGVILTYMRAFTLGDRVKIAETVGDVVEKTLLVTRIRTIKNVDITIPNSMVLGSHITNYSSSAQSYGLILHTSVTIGYDAPWRTVHELLIGAAKATEHILELPEPFVFQTSLDDFYVTYELNAYTDKPLKMAAIYSELHQHIQDKFNEAGVEIMSPHYSQIRDGNSTTTPEAYLPSEYVPSAFRILQTGGNEGSGVKRDLPGSNEQ